MAERYPLSFQRHGRMHWTRFRSYNFARTQAIGPVGVSELPRLIGWLPIGFTASGSGYRLVAVLGNAPDRNLFVRSDGRWRVPYVPAFLRSHPFYLAETGDDRWGVVVDEASGLVAEDNPDGEPLFDADGNPTQGLQPVLDFLGQLAGDWAATDRAVAALAAEGLIERWPVTVTNGQGEPRQMKGLYRVAEEKLNQIDGNALERLRDAGALAVAYAQLMNQQTIHRLSDLAQIEAKEAAAQQQAAHKQAEHLGVDFTDVFGEGDTLDFDRLE